MMFGHTTVSIQKNSRPDASECLAQAATAAMSKQRFPSYFDSATLLTSNIAFIYVLRIKAFHNPCRDDMSGRLLVQPIASRSAAGRSHHQSHHSACPCFCKKHRVAGMAHIELVMPDTKRIITTVHIIVLIIMMKAHPLNLSPSGMVKF